MSTQDDLKSRFVRFREQKYAMFIGLALAFVVCSLLLVFSPYLLCFGLLLVALAGYYIPYFFGLRDRKKLAIWGIVLILLLSIPYSISMVEGQKASANNLLRTSDGAMTNGTVEPFKGDSSTVHEVSELVTDQDYSDVRVIVYDVWTGITIYNRSMVPTNNSDGTLYTFTTTLQNRTEYGYWFIADDGDRYVTTSNMNYGPMHVTDGVYAHWMPLLVLALFIEVGLLYFLLLILGWWTDKSKARLAEMQKQRAGSAPSLSKEGQEEKFICSECGAEVPASAGRCPQCGESFDEEERPTPPVKEKEEFVCTECGATVDEKAKTCWNCGKEFED
jgi:ribosomal protein L40E